MSKIRLPHELNGKDVYMSLHTQAPGSTPESVERLWEMLNVKDIEFWEEVADKLNILVNIRKFLR